MLTSLLYEQSVLDPNFIDLPVPSKEFVIYLNWKIYKSDDDKFAKSILDSLEKRYKINSISFQHIVLTLKKCLMMLSH